jgi:excisionase family DNA binding protein
MAKRGEIWRMSAPDVEGIEPLLLTPEEAGVALRVSRSVVYQLLASGAVVSVKIGGARRIPLAALRAYVASLMEDAA